MCQSVVLVAALLKKLAKDFYEVLRVTVQSNCGDNQDQTTKPLWFEDFCPASIPSHTSELDDVARFTTPSLLTLPTVSP